MLQQMVFIQYTNHTSSILTNSPQAYSYYRLTNTDQAALTRFFFQYLQRHSDPFVIGKTDISFFCYVKTCQIGNKSVPIYSFW